MGSVWTFIVALVALLAWARSTPAAEFIVTIDNPVHNHFIVAELPAPLTNITGIIMRAQGIGGREQVECPAPTGVYWRNVQLVVNFGSGQAVVPTTTQVPFDTTVPMSAAAGWAVLEGESSWPATVSDDGGPPPTHCTYGILSEPVAVSRLTFTITGDATTPTAASAWGCVKALYR